MTLDSIVASVNVKLAGEMLTFSQLQVFLDATIDDINADLDAKFPTFSEFENNKANYSNYPDYNFFPDRFIRTVVVSGAAYKFFVTDEEGIATAPQYAQEYDNARFLMLRDYADQVPEAYDADDNQGYVRGPGFCNLNTGVPNPVRNIFTDF